MHRSSFLAVLLPFALLACAVETAPEDKEDTAAAKVADSKTETKGETAEASQSSAIQKDPLPPFCLPGEKRVCTLGPPPVCHCQLPTTLPIEGVR